MKSLPVFALPEVEGDLRSAMEHYASWRSDGAQHILEKYNETIEWLAWNPEGFPKKFSDIRRAILKRSYYIVYFLMERERSVVLAVLDARRDPREIRSLLHERRRSEP